MASTTEAKRRVLLVEDDADLRGLLSSALRGARLNVVEASGVREAIDQLDQDELDLVILDGMLHDGDGSAVVERLRAQDDGVPILFVTSVFQDPSTVARWREELGVETILYKPFTAKELVLRARALLEKRSMTAGTMSAVTTFATLKETYHGKLVAKLDELGELVDSARETPVVEPALLESVLRLSHKLHGTAGTYGFTTVSKAMGCIEDSVSLARRSHEEVDWLTVTAALREARASIEHSPPSSSGLLRRTLERSRSGSILVVDGDDASRGHAMQVAQEANLDVAAAASAPEALRLAARRQFDAVFIDASTIGFSMMPRLRAIEGYRHVRVGAMADDTSLERRVRALHAGASSFLEKPVRRAQFEEVAQRLTHSSRASKPRVLIVDDDVEFAAYAANILGELGYVAHQLDDPLRVLDELQSSRPDLLLLDLHMPKMSGEDVCKVLRASARWQDLPILFTSISQERDAPLACFRAGGDDFIRKPVLREELVARVRVWVERSRHRRDLAHLDGLTGLMNRRAFSSAFEQVLADAKQRGTPVCLVMVDIDYFKKVNDQHGHLVGDEVLRSLGEFFQARLRQEDLRCRWGGEEFTLAIVDAGLDDARVVLERILEDVRAEKFKSDRGEQFRITVSAGIAAFPPDGDTLEVLLRTADMRLYSAKRAGRDRVVTTDAVASDG